MARTVARTVDLGLILKKELPYVHVVSEHHASTVCSYCLKRASNKALKRCTGCRVLHYCNAECQKLDWADHKAECSCFAEAYPNIGFAGPRLLARILMKRKRSVKPAFNGRTLESLESLNSRTDDVIKTQQGRILFRLTKTSVQSQLGSKNLPNDAELQSLLGKIVAHGTDICDYKGEVLAMGLYIGLSVLPDSCDPDAFFDFAGTELLLRPMKEEVTVYDQELRVSHSPILECGFARRKLVPEAHEYSACELCHDTGFSTVGRSLRCQFCSHGYCPLDLDGDEVQSEPVCEVCGLISEADVSAAVALMKDLDNEKTVLKLAWFEYRSDQDARTALSAAMELYKKARKSLSPLNIPLCRLAMEVIVLAKWNGSLDLCSQLEEETLVCFRHFLYERDPNLHMKHFFCGTAHLRAGKMELAEQRLKQYFKFCLQTFGRDGAATKAARSYYTAALGNDTEWMEELILKRNEAREIGSS